MKIKNYIFDLPEKLIPQWPTSNNLKLLVINKDKIEHKKVFNLADYFSEGDTLILNDTKVIPTRLWGIWEKGGEVEIDLITKIKSNLWRVIIRPELKVRNDRLVYFGDYLKGMITDKKGSNYLMRFFYKGNFLGLLKRQGQINLPFYLRNDIRLKDYQTAYAKREGSTQPPTAGFYITKRLLSSLKEKGVNISFVTLHIGASILSFNIKNIKDFKIEKEYYIVSKKTAGLINRTKEQGKRVIAVGTTVVRALETVGNNNVRVKADKGWTDLTIKPGYKFKVIDGLVTNFHQPGSSHLLLTSAFLQDKKKLISIYKEAIKRSYRFLDFGDKMLII